MKPRRLRPGTDPIKNAIQVYEARGRVIVKLYTHFYFIHVLAQEVRMRLNIPSGFAP